jgi:hypothetical protein
VVILPIYLVLAIVSNDDCATKMVLKSASAGTPKYVLGQMKDNVNLHSFKFSLYSSPSQYITEGALVHLVRVSSYNYMTEYSIAVV